MSTWHSTSHSRFDWFGLAIVLAVHVGVLVWLYQQRLVPLPRTLEPLFVHFITPEPPPVSKPPEPVKRQPPKPRAEKKPPPKPVEPPPPQQIVVQAPPVTPAEPVAPPPPPPEPAPEPVVEAPPVLAPVAPKPVTLTEELSVSCPGRTPPLYPALSRRLREQGEVLLRVELDEQGRVSAARIEKPSGAQRLDDAALAAVRGWRCNPTLREGRPVRAIALQPFNFVLQ
jgi:protein TonB